MAISGDKIDEGELLLLLKSHRAEAIGYYTDQISAEQETALKRYQGWPYGDEVEGRSQVVSEDAAQVVDWTLPDLLEPFVAGEAVVVFEPVRPGDEQIAKQATDYTNYVFRKDNDGFKILYDAAKDGLIQKIGVSKATWRDCQVTEQHRVEGVNLMRLQELQADETLEVTEVEERDLGSLAPLAEDADLEQLAAEYPNGKAYDVAFTREVDKSRVEILSIPPEEFKISPRQADINKTPYCAHERRQTKSYLLSLGFDEDQVAGLSPYLDQYSARVRQDVRFDNERRRIPSGGQIVDPWQEQVLLLEEYVQVDIDGDGDTEWVQVFRVDDEILSTEDVGEHPFEAFSPYPMPHKVIGDSLVDKTLQTQRIKTVLTRQLLDNVYLSNNPQREVPEGAVTDDGATYDDLLTFRVGGLVRTKAPGQIREISVADRSGVTLQSIGYFDQVRDMETGAVRGSAGMSSEAIDKTQPITAEESRRTGRSQQKRTRMLARVFAECYLAPLLRKVFRLLVKYQDFERVIRLRGEYHTMDPRVWNSDMDTSIAVGLGYPNREEQYAASEAMLRNQLQALEAGMTNMSLIYNTLQRQTAALGMGDASNYYIDPDSDEGQALAAQREQQANQQQVDPATVRAQVDGQVKMAKVQQDGQLAAARLQQQGQIAALKLQQDGRLAELKLIQDARLAEAKAAFDVQMGMLKLQADVQGDEAKTAADFQIDMERIEADFAASVEKINRDTALRAEQLERETALKAEQMAREHALAIDEQDSKVALAVREQNLEVLTGVATSGQPQINGGNGIGAPVRFGGTMG